MSADLSSITPKADAPPGTLAPRDPDRPAEEEQRELEERRLRFKPLHEFLNNTLDAIDALDRDRRYDLFTKRLKSHKMCGGEMVGVIEGDHWVNTSRPEDQIYTVPEYTAHVEAALVEVIRSRTELNCEPTVEDDPAKRELAQFCKDRLDFNRQRRMNAFFSVREGLFLILSGTGIRNTFYSTSIGSGLERVPVSEKKTVSANLKTKRCLYCSLPTSGDVCPSCGGQKFKEVESRAFEASVVTRTARIPYGGVMVESVDPDEVNTSLHAKTLADSPFLQRKRLVPRAHLEARFKTTIPSTGIRDAKLKLQHEERLQGERSGGEQFEMVEFEQVWLSPELYHDYELPEEARLLKGKTIEKGVRLAKKFPRGLYFARVGRKILDLRHESKDDHWTGVPFRMKPKESAGGGFDHLIPLAEQKNVLRSLQFIDVHYNSTRREFVNTSTGLRASHLTADPTQAVEVSFDPQSANFTSAYYQSSGQTSLQHTQPLVQEISGDMRNASGTMSASGATQEMRELMGTATGAALAREMQTNRYSPALWLRAEMDAEQGFQILELEQRFMPREQLDTLKGRYGERAIREFMNSDLRADLRIEPVPGSWMPQSQSQRVANTEAYLSLKARSKRGLTDEDLSLAADAYQVPFELAEHRLAEKMARQHIEVFKALSNLLESSGYTDPQYAKVVYEQSGCQINPFLDRPESLIEEYADWRLSDEGQAASPLLVASVEMAVKACMNAGKERAKYLKTLELEAQEPEANAQLLLQDAQSQQQEEAQRRQIEQGMETQAAATEQALEAEAVGTAIRQEDREHELASKGLEVAAKSVVG